MATVVIDVQIKQKKHSQLLSYRTKGNVYKCSQRTL